MYHLWRLQEEVQNHLVTQNKLIEEVELLKQLFMSSELNRNRMELELRDQKIENHQNSIDLVITHGDIRALQKSSLRYKKWTWAIVTLVLITFVCVCLFMGFEAFDAFNAFDLSGK